MRAEDRVGVLAGRERRELEDRGQVVGQLAAGQLEPGLAVAPLEAEQRRAALAAVAVAVVGEVQRRALVEVERRDVLLADGPRVATGAPVEELAQSAPAGAGTVAAAVRSAGVAASVSSSGYSSRIAAMRRAVERLTSAPSRCPGRG